MTGLKVSKRRKLQENVRRSRDHEKESAFRLGTQQTRGSGSGRVKGDARIYGLVRIENKVTKFASLRVTEEMISKIEDAVFGTDEIPVIEVKLVSGRVVHIIPDWALRGLLDAAAKS